MYLDISIDKGDVLFVVDSETLVITKGKNGFVICCAKFQYILNLQSAVNHHPVFDSSGQTIRIKHRYLPLSESGKYVDIRFQYNEKVLHLLINS